MQFGVYSTGGFGFSNGDAQIRMVFIILNGRLIIRRRAVILFGNTAVRRVFHGSGLYFHNCSLHNLYHFSPSISHSFKRLLLFEMRFQHYLHRLCEIQVKIIYKYTRRTVIATCRVACGALSTDLYCKFYSRMKPLRMHRVVKCWIEWKEHSSFR